MKVRQQNKMLFLPDNGVIIVLVPIDKAANNVSIICKRYYVEVILKEIGIIGEGNNTYERSKMSKEEIIDHNAEYSKRLNMEVSGKELDLPIMYWLPKKHKDPTGKRFIIASKQCSTKQISKAVSYVFKLIYNQVENFHKKAKFLSTLRGETFAGRNFREQKKREILGINFRE